MSQTAAHMRPRFPSLNQHIPIWQTFWLEYIFIYRERGRGWRGSVVVSRGRRGPTRRASPLNMSPRHAAAPQPPPQRAQAGRQEGQGMSISLHAFIMCGCVVALYAKPATPRTVLRVECFCMCPIYVLGSGQIEHVSLLMADVRAGVDLLSD